MQAAALLQYVPTVLKVVGAVSGANQQADAAKYNARQLEKAGKEQYAASTREAYEEARRGRILESNAKAAMASSGGVTTDPGAIGILGKIGADTEYNVLAALYEGQIGKDKFDEQAALERMKGKQASKAGAISAVSTILTSASDKFKSTKKATVPWTDPNTGKVYRW